MKDKVILPCSLKTRRGARTPDFLVELADETVQETAFAPGLYCLTVHWLLWTTKPTITWIMLQMPAFNQDGKIREAPVL